MSECHQTPGLRLEGGTIGSDSAAPTSRTVRTSSTQRTCYQNISTLKNTEHLSIFDLEMESAKPCPPRTRDIHEKTFDQHSLAPTSISATSSLSCTAILGKCQPVQETHLIKKQTTSLCEGVMRPLSVQEKYQDEKKIMNQKKQELLRMIVQVIKIIK